MRNMLEREKIHRYENGHRSQEIKDIRKSQKE